ncbi:LppU/SCO3897 family protein [Geodermatophilus sp. CPCC 205761]|uniref:LppU/SCO3897 family protein n=1 Tax=Geodermatophilus sp. CPCC 205761 TaxID=2936597 RepID=UPI003EF0128F
MTHPGPGTDPAAPQPGSAPWGPPPAAQPQPGAWNPPQQGGWNPPQPGAPAPATSKAKKWLRVGVPVAVAGVLGLGGLGSVLGLGDPEVGDCVQMQGDTSFDVVDCAAAEAEYRIVGIEAEEQDYATFMADPDTCADFLSTEVALWIGGLETEPGTIYCAEPR